MPEIRVSRDDRTPAGAALRLPRLSAEDGARVARACRRRQVEERVAAAAEAAGAILAALPAHPASRAA